MSQFYKNNTVYLKVNSTFSIPTVLSFSKHQKKKMRRGEKKGKESKLETMKGKEEPKKHSEL